MHPTATPSNNHKLQCTLCYHLYSSQSSMAQAVLHKRMFSRRCPMPIHYTVGSWLVRACMPGRAAYRPVPSQLSARARQYSPRRPGPAWASRNCVRSAPASPGSDRCARPRNTAFGDGTDADTATRQTARASHCLCPASRRRHRHPAPRGTGRRRHAALKRHAPITNTG